VYRLGELSQSGHDPFAHPQLVSKGKPVSADRAVGDRDHGGATGCDARVMLDQGRHDAPALAHALKAAGADDTVAKLEAANPARRQCSAGNRGLCHGTSRS